MNDSNDADRGVGVDLQRVVEAVGVGAFAWEVGSQSVAWSPELGPLFGRARGAAPKDFGDYASWLHPDDCDEVLGTIFSAVEGDAAGYTVEHRVVWPDGTQRWIEGRGVVERDATGKALRVMGIALDITARRQG